MKSFDELDRTLEALCGGLSVASCAADSHELPPGAMAVHLAGLLEHAERAQGLLRQWAPKPSADTCMTSE